MYNCNASASTVAHTENCIIEVLGDMKKNGATEKQIQMAEDVLELLESLYMCLREPE